MSFPERLKTIRTAKGISREGLAQHLGLSYHTIAKWETGKRDPDTATLLQLARFFHVSTDYLLGLSDAQNQSRSPETEAAHRIDDPTAALPEDAQQSIKDFKKFIFDKHGIKYD